MPATHSDNDDLDTRWLAAIGDQAAMERYYWFSRYEESNRLQSRRKLTETIDLWQRAIEIRCRPLASGEKVTSQATNPDVEPMYQHLSFDFRLSQSILSISTSKVALDAILEGYYSQGLMLLRNAFEAAKRIAYARRSPGDSFRWYPRHYFSEDMLQKFAGRYVFGPPQKSDWRRVFPDQPGPGEAEFLDWHLNQGINALIDDLHGHVHPSTEGAEQQRLETPQAWALSPEFNEDRSFFALRLGCFAETYLMHELAQLLPEKTDWMESVEQWRDDVSTHFDFDSVISMEETVLRMREHESRAESIKSDRKSD